MCFSFPDTSDVKRSIDLPSKVVVLRNTLKLLKNSFLKTCF